MAVRHVGVTGWDLTHLLWMLIAVNVVMLVAGTPLVKEPDHHVFPLSVTTDHDHTSGSCPDFPDLLRAAIEASDPFPQSLELYRKDVTSTEVPVYVLRRDSHGVVYTERVESDGEKSAAYQNQEYGAAFLVKCTDDGRFSIAGTLYVKGHKYRVRHSYDVTSSWEVTSFYEFARVNTTIHYDDLLQEKRNDRRRVNTGNLDLHSETSGPAARAKREAENYYIDVLVVLDYAFYQFWLNRSDDNSTAAIQQAKEYVAYIYNEIDTKFNGISNDNYQLNVVLSAFIVAQTPDDSPWTEEVKQAIDSGGYQVKAESVLTNLENYVRDNYDNLPPHNHLMLVTEHDLYSETDNGFRFNNTAGFAYVATVCLKDGSSVSVVEDHGGFQSETTATHELGHSLGAKHDGDGNVCKSEDSYIMSGSPQTQTEDNKLNPWRFSECSIAAFDTYLQSLTASEQSDCLTQRESPVEVPTVMGFPGQHAGPDEQCRQIYGASSYLCRGTAFGAPEHVCNSMYCLNPALQSQCTLNTAATGTCCGYRKWCSEGECVDAPSSTCYTSATCPFGQRQGAVYGDLTCDQLDSGNCYTENFRLVCCEMCDRERSDVYDCEFGDKVRNCNATFCGETLPVTEELYDVQCCRTCNRQPVTPPPTPATDNTTLIVEVPGFEDPCRDTALVNGTEQCSVFLDRAGLAYCCQTQVQDFCCRSCEDRRSQDDPDCPYGDCAICTNLLQLPVPCTDQQRVQCCHTCDLVDQRLTSPSPALTPAPADTTPSITNPPATITTSAVVVEEEECEEILGVVTCGVQGSILVGGWGVVWSGVVLARSLGAEWLRV